MRFSKASRLLRLILDLQSSRTGLSLADIEQRFEVGRRTAQRMKSTVLRQYPNAISETGEDRRQRWRLSAGGATGLLDVTSNELADLDSVAKWLSREGLVSHADTLDRVASKLRAGVTPEVARRIEPDLDALIEAEGLAARPGLRPGSRPEILEVIRLAIKRSHEVTIQYRLREGTRRVSRTLRPYGVIFGTRHYLLGFAPGRHQDRPHLYALSGIEKISIGQKPFVRDPSFSLRAFADRSFGSYQEEPHDVVWLFAPEAAAEARDHLFHPSQQFEQQPDGSLIVRFKAGGLREMCWHLFTWGDRVSVLAPAALQELVAHWPRPRIAPRPTAPGSPTRSTSKARRRSKRSDA